MLLAASAVACGGGGSSAAVDTGPIDVTFAPTTARTCWQPANTSNATLSVTATLSRVPTDIAAVKVIVPPGDIDPNSVQITNGAAANLFVFTAHPYNLIGLGLHAGTLAFELCKDLACTSKHDVRGASLPYEIQVVPDPVLIVSVGGSPLTGAGGSYPVASGATVSITSDGPVTWGQGSALGPPTLTVASTTATTWTGSVTGASGEWIQVTATGLCGGTSTGTTWVTLALP
jgi:hypothetical protein